MTRNIDQWNGRRRAVVERVTPEIDEGAFPAKRVAGDEMWVEADVFADGHDAVRAVLRHRRAKARRWSEVEMSPIGGDRWRAAFIVSELGPHEYTVVGWVDHFDSWLRDTRKKIEASQDVSLELRMGAELVRRAAERAKGRDAERLTAWAQELEEASGPQAVLDAEPVLIARRYPDRSLESEYPRVLPVLVDPPRARFSTWYELFPRSWGEGRHGTFTDVVKNLDYVAQMGFDVLYLPPIHPIGRTHRKGRNNAPAAGPDDVGSPWGIGAAEGGHDAIHPDLGSMADFERLVETARDRGIEIALDIAFQCSPDHPWVSEHPEWFRHRPDGSIQYAENPPKRYQDIYPLDFESEDWQGLWTALRDVVAFWVSKGVRIFRVDNPHTKAFGFWEWMIGEIKAEHPDVIFLSEAFTRPRVMYRLAKLGFSQSYTYFTWRNTRRELEDYFAELVVTEVSEYFRPNLWPNTPDILSEYLQFGGPSAFRIRLVLAATLGASYGIYGPAFELTENEPLQPGSEEYMHSEKYEIRDWDIDRPDSLRDLIARVNEIRHANPALHRNESLRFHETENESLIAYSKVSADTENVIVVVCNLDPHHTHAGTLHLPLADLGIDETTPYQVHDLLTDARYLWDGPHNYVELNPHSAPAHIFRLRHRVRREHDFDYFM